MGPLRFYSARFDSVPKIGCSPPSWAVWLALLDKGLSFEHRELAFDEKEHKQPAYMLLNPRGTLPALAVGERVVSDTIEMLRTVDELELRPALIGENDALYRRGLRRLGLAGALKEKGMAWLASHMREQPDVREKKMVYADALQEFAETLGDELYFACPSEGTARPGLADWLAYAYVATTAHLGMPVDAFASLSEWKRLLDMHPHVRATAPRWLNYSAPPDDRDSLPAASA